MTDKEVFFEVKGTLGLITLNRPKALNALTLSMVREIHPQLKEWENDSSIKNILIKAEGERAFCAGGDIRALHDWGKNNDEEAVGFYREEYILNQYIKRYPKPYISLVNGIVMGGGVGLSVHGSHRIAGENYSFAMPETGIGLFPDVGGSFFLPRLSFEAGTYLALTGNRIKAADAIFLGTATNFIKSENFSNLINDLSKEENDPKEIIDKYSVEPGESEFREISQFCNKIFKADTVEKIIENLTEENSDLSKKILSIIDQKSPTSLKVALKSLRLGKNISFEECMQMEFRMVNKVMNDHDFYEGVRALIIDKDNNTSWKPSNIYEVEENFVDKFFSSLDDDLKFN
jgi:enoyl-CoA hydratase